MNIRNLLVTVTLLIAVLIPLSAQTYARLWQEVENFEAKGLPRSALDTALRIYAKARAEYDAPQLMKAYLTAMHYRALITPDSLQTDINVLTHWADTARRTTDRAMLCSLAGELLMRRDLPAALTYLRRSLVARDTLLSVSASAFRPLVETGATSQEYFRDNLYELLARRAVSLLGQNSHRAAAVANQTDVLPPEADRLEGFERCVLSPVSTCDFSDATLQVYQSLLQVYDADATRSAWLLTAIDVLNYLHRSFPATYDAERCADELQVLFTRYAENSVGPEVALALSGYQKALGEFAERLSTVREAMTLHPHAAIINALRNVEQEVLCPALALRVAPAYPGASHDLRINYRNLSGFTLLLYKVDLPVTSAVLQSLPRDFESRYARLQHSEHYALRPTTDYREVDTVICLQAPPAGLYYLKAIPDGRKGHPATALFHVTAFKTIYRPLPGKNLEMVVVDARSGHPVSGAEVQTYARQGEEYVPLEAFLTDDRGMLSIDSPQDRSVLYNVRKADDNAMPVTSLWTSSYQYSPDKRTREVVRLFTDRAAYRPGQTVYVAGLACEQRGDSVRVLADRPYVVTLHDANGKEAGRADVRTNAFGSFSGEFVLPSACLPGIFRIRTNGSSTTIRVEEYRRPSFEVTFLPVETDYQADDSLTLTGEALMLAGVPVQEGRVHYRVTRMASWFWHAPGGGRSAQWEGDTVTDAVGRFQVPVHLQSEPTAGGRFAEWYYTYRVEADVTDATGETCRGEVSLPLASVSLRMNVDGLPTTLIREQATQMQFAVCRLSGERTDAEVHYCVTRLSDSVVGDTVLTATAPANRLFIPTEIYALPSGRYRLMATVLDDRGRPARTEADFLLFSPAEGRLPDRQVDWFLQDGTEFCSDSVPVVYFGTSERDVYLFYDVFAGDRRVESRHIQLSDSLLCFRFPYRVEYGEGVLVSLAFVRNGQLYSHQARIVRPRPDKQLRLEWSVFRDRLRPGQHEEWRLRVLRPDGRSADAELLATLYDSSLDVLYGHHALPFALSFVRTVPRTPWGASAALNTFLRADFPWKRLAVPLASYSKLTVPLSFVADPQVRALAAGTYRQSKNVAMEELEMTAMDAVTPTVTSREEEPEDKKDVLLGREGYLVPIDSLREDLSETAFFYPQLRTDSTGEVTLSFLLPESLTRWRFLALAHTREADYGGLETEVTASKEFMLQSNVPRFVRAGDEAIVAASLVNLSDVSVKGTVRMELFCPESGRVIVRRKQLFTVGAGRTDSVRFSFAISGEQTLLACRLMAEGDRFSDGEQRFLPVLSDRRWTTEAMSIDVNDAGHYVFGLDSLFNGRSQTATDRRLTVEFTASPAWYVVQALPVLGDPQTDDALAWATAWYARSLAGYIANRHPRIRQVVDGWMAQGEGSDALLGQLEKNAELKEILLSETPWVVEAENETDRRNRLSMLFDLNTFSSRLALSVARLRELQDKTTGAWSWYRGMPASRTVTTQVTELLVRLYALTGQPVEEDVLPLYRRAMAYLAVEAKRESENMKEIARRTGERLPRPSEQALHYLYICALADANDCPSIDRAVNRYLVDCLSVHVDSFTLYGKALAAIVLHADGQIARATEVMRSVMEYAVETPTMGCYFDTPRASSSWRSYRIPTEVAVMEALRRTGHDAAAINGMKRWLLKQKQVQAWVDPVASADAIYALLATDDGMEADLLRPTERVTLTLGRDTLCTPTDEAMGYLHVTLTGRSTDARSLTVEKTSGGAGWGAVYAQYLENADRLPVRGDALTVSRSLQRIDGTPVGADTLVRVGEELVVCLTVTADRDMDFVQLIDERPACLAPVDSRSGYRVADGRGYYLVTKDASTRLFFGQMPKGSLTVRYRAFADRAGRYRSGEVTVCSAYVPEFGGRESAYLLTVEE